MPLGRSKICFCSKRAKERGSTLISGLFLVLFTSFFGLAIVQLDSVDSRTSTNNLQGSQALYAGQAGLEYAKKKLDVGLSPDVVNQDFGDGTYTITSDLVSQTVTSDAVVGDARKVQTIQGNFSDSCVTLDTSAAYISGPNLKGVKLVKTCNTAAIVTKMTIDWNWPQCGLQTGDDPYAPYYDPGHPGKIYICHLPNGDPDKANTISVGIDEWENGHSSHSGDYLGECGGDGGGGEAGDSSGGDPAPCDDFDHDGDHDHQGAVIEGLSLEGTTLYDSSLGIGQPNPGGAQPNVMIDVVDYTLTTNGNYTFAGPNSDILFSVNIPAGGWYMITVEFADYSTIDSVFTP